MNEELDLPCRYKVALDTSRNSYKFTTDTGAQYEVLFVLDNAIFTASPLQSFDVYSFAINKLRPGSGLYDPQIRKTISAILSHFFEDRDRVLTYVYDSTDGKELVRKRMFRRWGHSDINRTKIRQIDAPIKTDDMTYQTGIIYHVENKAGEEKIANSFEDVINALTQK